MYDAFVAYGLQYLLHKRRMKFYRKMYAAALLSEFLQHAGRILNAYFPKDKLAEIFLTAVQCGMPHREGVRRLLYDLDFNHGSLRFRSWDNSIFSQGTFAGYDNAVFRTLLQRSFRKTPMPSYAGVIVSV